RALVSGCGKSLAAEELARLCGVVGSCDEDDEDAAVLRRDVAELEVLDVDLRRAENLRDARKNPGAVGDADTDAVQLCRLGLVRERLEPLARRGRGGDRGLELVPPRDGEGVERRAKRREGVVELVAVLDEDVRPERRVRAGDAGHLPERRAGLS